VVFTGTYEHTIDAKRRLAVPSELRSQIQRATGATGDDPLVLVVALGEGGALRLYTEPVFERRAEELEASELDADELLDYERVFFSLARRVEMDRAGRIRLPDNLLEMAGLGNEVVLLGVKDHLEVRDRDAWREHLDEVLKTRASMLMDPRRAMKKTAKKKDQTPEA
jgi:MraZ protein